MYKHAVRAGLAHFYLDFNQVANGTMWVLMERGAGKIPTFWDVWRAIQGIHKTHNVLRIFRDGLTWSPTGGWMRKNLMTWEKPDPWRIIYREGYSGCTDYTITQLDTNSRFGAEFRLCNVHVSSRGRLNQGLEAPVPFLEYLSDKVPPSFNDSNWVHVREIPEEDTRKWRVAGLL